MQQAFQSLSKVEQIALANHLKNTQNIDQMEKEWSKGGEAFMKQQQDNADVTFQKKANENKKLQEYLKLQIMQKQKVAKEALNKDKYEYNTHLNQLPEDQVCIFPKINQSPKQIQVQEKLHKQQINDTNFREQLISKHALKEQQLQELCSERQIADKIKDEYEQEQNEKKKKTIESMKEYNSQLTLLSAEKLQQQKKEEESNIEQPIEDEGTPKYEDPELKIIDQYFEEDPANTDNVVTTTEPETSKVVAKEASSNEKQTESIYQSELMKKIEKYNERMKKRGKQIYSVEMLKKLVMTSEGKAQKRNTQY